MGDDYQTFRVTAAAFPVRFAAIGWNWTLETRPIPGAACWRAHLVREDAHLRGSAGYFVGSARDGEALARKLSGPGVAVLRRCPVGTLLRAMVAQGLAEVAHSSAS